jgi:tetratricopeptide (TPR) repeat protein
MLLTSSYELKTAFAYARTFSLERKLFYIDSQMILLGILDSYASDIAIDNADREKLVQWLHSLNWEQRPGTLIPTGNRPKVPIMTEAERMLENAAYYQKKLGDEQLHPQHIILSLLSIENRCQYKFQSLGIIFDGYLEQIRTLRNIQTDVPFRSPRIKTSHISFFHPLIRLFYGPKQKHAAVERYFREAQSLLQYNDIQKCRALCHLVLQMQPDHVNALWLSGVTWRVERNFQKALPFYEKVHKKHPQHTGVLAELAHCHSELGNHAWAQRLYEHALSLNPGSSELLNSLGFECIKLELYVEAISYFDQAIAYDEECAYAYNNKGYVLMHLGFPAAARELILKSLQFNKGNAYAYRNLALLALKEQDEDTAREMLLKAQRFHFKRNYGNEVDELLRRLDKQKVTS